MNVVDKPAGKDTPTVPSSSKILPKETQLQSHGNLYKRPKYNHKRDVHHNPKQGNRNSRQVNGRGGPSRIMGKGMSSNKANGSHDP